MALFLIVDDSMLQRKIISEFVKMEGHELLEATDGEKGLETAIAQKPDFIISDLIMPNMDGFELIEALSKHDLKIPIIITTADIQEDVRQQCMEQGVFQFLNKPLKEDELREAIKGIVDLKRGINQ